MGKCFYRVEAPAEYEYARFSRRGTWKPSSSPGLCKECGMTSQKRVPPLIIEWEVGSDVIGDFVWGGLNFELVVRADVAGELKRRFRGFVIRKVKMIAPTDKRQVKKKQRVFLPYSGPELREIWITAWASLDEKRSHLKLEKACSTCGFRFYKSQQKGLMLTNDEVKSRDFFRVKQFPGWIFCSAEAKRFIEASKYTNVAFLNAMRMLPESKNPDRREPPEGEAGKSAGPE